MVIALAIVNLAWCSKFVLCGGGAFEDESEPFSKFAEVAGKSGYVGVVTAASADEVAEENGQYYVELFKEKHGVASVEWIPIRLR